MKKKLLIGSTIIIIILLISTFVYFRYLFTYEQRNVFQRNLESITGQNLTITIFSFDGKIIKRWVGIEKISSGKAKDQSGERNYTFFYTKDNKYVQIPDSVWYIAEEE